MDFWFHYWKSIFSLQSYEIARRYVQFYDILHKWKLLDPNTYYKIYNNVNFKEYHIYKCKQCDIIRATPKNGFGPHSYSYNGLGFAFDINSATCKDIVFKKILE